MKLNQTSLDVANLNNIISQFSSLPDIVVWVRSADYQRQLYLSQSFDAIWGVSSESWIEVLLPEERACVLSQIERRIQAMQQGVEADILYYRIHNPSAGIICIKDWCYPLYGQNGIFLAILGFFQVVNGEEAGCSPSH